MNYKEISKLLKFDEDTGYESKLFMPNEIFEDLKKNSKIKNSPHIAFSYSYTYLATWIYRYAKHLSTRGLIDNSIMKEILGYNPTTKGLDYLIKKNGVLDEMNYTRTVKDFPTFVHYTHEFGSQIEFDMLSGLDEDDEEDIKKEFMTLNKISRKYFIKYPVKAFFRNWEDEEQREIYENSEDQEDGTFYFIENTHLVPFEVFLFCMSNEKLGCEAFYLYSYLQYKNQIHKDGYDVSIENLAIETGLNDRTSKNYLAQLKGYRMIKCIHNQDFFAVGMRKEDRKANTYITYDYDLFLDKPTTYKKIKVMPRKEYLLKLKLEKEEEIKKWESNEAIQIPIEQLPF
jgi:hypothetical protein